MSRSLGLAVVLALAACGPSNASSAAPAAVISRPVPSPPPSLATAIRDSFRLGPAGEATTVWLSFGLKVRDPARLASMIASGGQAVIIQNSSVIKH